MSNLDSLITDLLAAQGEETAHQAAANAAVSAMEAATQRVLQLGGQLLDMRGGNAPFLYNGRLYTFQGSRVSSAAVETVTLGAASPEAPVQDGGEASND